MKAAITQIQHEPYVVYACSGCSWQVLIKQDGNEQQYEAAFRTEWEGDALFTLFPRAATGDQTALLHLRLPVQRTGGGRLARPAAISTHCHIPAVVQIEPIHRRILIELRCVLASLTEPPTMRVVPDPEVAFHFLHPEEEPLEASSRGHVPPPTSVPLTPPPAR